MLIYELAALGAATCWALTSLISAAPAGHLGAPAFNRLRQIFVAVLLAAATCQAFASLIMRPLMASGIDPFAASMLRVAIAATALTVMMQLPTPAIQQQNPLNTRAVMVTALSGFLALAVGMTLLLFALSGGNVGIVSSLSATSPVIILPLIWLRTRQRQVPVRGAARRS